MVATVVLIVVPNAVVRAATVRRVEIVGRVVIARKSTAPHALIARRATVRRVHRVSARRVRKVIDQHVRRATVRRVHRVSAQRDRRAPRRPSR